MKLPVWQTIVAAYAFVFGNWREAVRIGWLPAVATTVLGFLVEYLPSDDGWPTNALALYGFAIWVAHAPIVAVAVVPWHRYILLNQKAPGGAIPVRLSAQAGRYVTLSVAIMAIVTGMNWAASLLAYSSGWLSGEEPVFVAFRLAVYLPIYAASYYASAVLSLVLPAVAVDRGSGLKGAVEMGYRNGWRLVVVILAAAAPYYVHHYGSSYLPARIRGVMAFPLDRNIRHVVHLRNLHFRNGAVGLLPGPRRVAWQRTGIQRDSSKRWHLSPDRKTSLS